MSGVFQFDLERESREMKEARSQESRGRFREEVTSVALNDEPRVPNKALVIVQFGVSHILYHQGNGLNYWLETMGSKEAAAHMVGRDHADGVFVWAGTVHGEWFRTDCGDEYSESLEGDLRPATAEEWRAFIADETVWDHEEMSAWLNWQFKQDAEF